MPGLEINEQRSKTSGKSLTEQIRPADLMNTGQSVQLIELAGSEPELDHMPERLVVGIINRSVTHRQSLHLHVIARWSITRNRGQITSVGIKKLVDQVIKVLVRQHNARTLSRSFLHQVCFQNRLSNRWIDSN